MVATLQSEFCISKFIILFISLLAFHSTRGAALGGLIQHAKENEDGRVEFVQCRPVHFCPNGTQVKICSQDGDPDECIPCGEGMEQPANSSSMDIRVCTHKGPTCAEEEEEVLLSNGTKVCRCKPQYCGKPPNCHAPKCKSGQKVDPHTCVCVPSSTTPSLPSSPPSSKPSRDVPSTTRKPLSVHTTATTTANTSLQSTVKDGTLPETGQAKEKSGQSSGLSSGVIVGICLGVGVLLLLLAFLYWKFCWSRRDQTVDPSEPVTPPPAPVAAATPQTLNVHNSDVVVFGNGNVVYHCNGQANGHANGHAHFPPELPPGGPQDPSLHGSDTDPDEDTASEPEPEEGAAADPEPEEDSARKPLLEDSERLPLPIEEEGQGLPEEGSPPTSPAVSIHGETRVKRP